jgi:hypothetical protein
MVVPDDNIRHINNSSQSDEGFVMTNTVSMQNQAHGVIMNVRVFGNL